MKIAVFTNGWSSEYLSKVIEGIRTKAEPDGTDIFIFTSYLLWGEEGERRKTKLNFYHLPDPEIYDGVIILTNTFSGNDEIDTIKRMFRGKRIPVISTEVKIPGFGFVGTSNYEGVRELADHLIEEHGVRKIIYVSGIADNEENKIRQHALEDSMEIHGLEKPDVIHGDFEFYSTVQHVGEWLKRGEPLPDAFVCANDYEALGVIYRLYEAGIKVPDDVLVTGFDNIREGQTTYPMVASVSRQWDQMGENIYDLLKKMIDDYDPNFEVLYDSTFVPSESCGCKPSEQAVEYRLDSIRNQYRNSSVSDMVEFQFQEIRGAMSKVDSKEAFFEQASESLDLKDYLGEDYCLCTQKQFFEKTDDEYVPETGYDRNMEVLFERKGHDPVPQRFFDRREIYPGYVDEEGVSNIYVITPLTNLDHNIGYFGVKNKPEILYDLCFKKFINNLDTLLETVRQYIFSQESNRKLKNIYMTDFLTGMYNRTGCEEILFSYLETEKNAGNDSVLLFTDIDCMKTINDVYGHINGDLAIGATAEGIRRTLNDEWKLGRFGGDEFVAVGKFEEGLTIEDYRDRFREALKDVIEEMKLTFNLTASVGYCIVTPESNGSIEDYIKIADASMYEEKERAHRAMGIKHE
ncbi:MAG: GGDEF domain-containing protein [Lachnospiraceae bacterium]|nr:GGDEF domain-containing protein [Lachnospiraceae bacterium]